MANRTVVRKRSTRQPSKRAKGVAHLRKLQNALESHILESEGQVSAESILVTHDELTLLIGDNVPSSLDGSVGFGPAGIALSALRSAQEELSTLAGLARKPEDVSRDLAGTLFQLSCRLRATESIVLRALQASKGAST